MHELATSDSTTRASTVLTLRGVEPALRSALDAEAARLGVSLNALILQILRGSLGLSASAQLVHDLDALAGSWSRAEAEEFAAAIQGFEEIDIPLWQNDPQPL
jgi:hypothetical protein